MGGKQRWTADEEQALRDGVDRCGPGKWRTIQKDPEFAQRLSQRSNVDLKDKWRNLTSDPSQKSAAKNRSQHGGASASKRGRGAKRGAASRGAAKRAAPGTPRRRGAMEAAAAAAVLMGGAGGAGPSHSHSAGPATGPKVEDMIIAAVISLCESRGSHADDIQAWIESQYSVARGFGRVLGPTLQHMVDTGRLEARPPPEPRYRLATLKYAACGDDAGSPLQSSLQSSDMRGAFDQTAFDAAQRAAAAVAEAAEAAAQADRLSDAANLFELAARQAEAESPTAGGGWVAAAAAPQQQQQQQLQQPKQEAEAPGGPGGGAA